METFYELGLNFLQGSGNQPVNYNTDTASSSVGTGDISTFIFIVLSVIVIGILCILLFRKIINKNINSHVSCSSDVVLNKFSVFISSKRTNVLLIIFSCILIFIVSAAILFGQANASESNGGLVGPTNINASVDDTGKVNIDKFTFASSEQNTCITGFTLEQLEDTKDANWTITFKGEKTQTYSCKADSKVIDTLFYIENDAKIEIELSVDMNVDTAKSLMGKKVLNIKFRELPGRDRYKGPYSAINGAMSACDSLGRETTQDNISHPLNNKDVGIFYFLWEGQHGIDGPYDNDKIYKSNPHSVDSQDDWIKAGGGEQQAHHFWGEPLYGYYTTDDEWIFRKHVQMLTDAGVDYLLFDTTNAATYDAQFEKLLNVWYEYYLQGYDVPKLAFYTHTKSEETMKHLYDKWYKKDSEGHKKFSRIDELWYRIDGKPLIVGDFDQADNQELNVSTISDTDKQNAIDKLNSNYSETSRQELLDNLTIKKSQWPNEPKKDNDSWPWIEFDRYMLPDCIYYDKNGKPMVTNVSVAQHNKTICFSATAWYGQDDRTRSFHDGRNDTSKDAYFHGYNIGQQWDYILQNFPDVPNVFVTGWNEWVAQRQSDAIKKEWPIYFVDCADPNNSRDIEPMAGPCGDNYYMQLIEKMRLYKGVDARVNVGDKLSIDTKGSFDQWNNPQITAIYNDYVDDIKDRNAKGFGNIEYKDTTGRNDFVEMKVCHDDNSLYFYAKCKDTIKGEESDNRTVLFLKTNDEGQGNWNGYTYAVNLAGPGKLSKCLGGWNWQTVSDLEYQIKDNQIMFQIPYSSVNLDAFHDGLVDIEFKWADNFQKDSHGIVDIMSFYKNGDVAPFGRLNFVYSDVAR